MSRAFDDLHRRPRRTLPTVATAAVLLLVALVVIGSAAQRLATGTWPRFVPKMTTTLERTAWVSPLTWGLGAALIVVGILLLGAALRPGRFVSAPLAGIAAPTEVQNAAAYLTSSGLARIAERRTADLDGVDEVAVRVTGRGMRAPSGPR